VSRRPRRREPPPAPREGAAPGRFGERLVVAVLVLMAAVLAWVRVSRHAGEAAVDEAVFDLRNPLLHARPGQCVEIVPDHARGLVHCVVVRPEGAVERPREGPVTLGHHRGLRSASPYLACTLHAFEPGSGGCATGTPAGEPEDQLYDLNGFGTLKDLALRVDSIRLTRIRVGGRAREAYEVAMQKYEAGGPPGTWIAYVAPDVPVLGLAAVRFLPQGAVQREQSQTYREAAGCPPR
jgi:hypothetical protein